MTYIDSRPQFRPCGGISQGHFWAAHTLDRLAWQHGHERAQRIRAGQDPTTNHDIAAWARLGRRSAA